jgi:hypothetical protein
MVKRGNRVVQVQDWGQVEGGQNTVSSRTIAITGRTGVAGLVCLSHCTAAPLLGAD